MLSNNTTLSVSPGAARNESNEEEEEEVSQITNLPLIVSKENILVIDLRLVLKKSESNQVGHLRSYALYFTLSSRTYVCTKTSTFGKGAFYQGVKTIL